MQAAGQPANRRGPLNVPPRPCRAGRDGARRLLLPPPVPPVWAPRLRRWLLRFCNRMDRRKARRLAATNQSILDLHWKAAYTQWWNEGAGWSTGAAPPDQAFTAMLAARRRVGDGTR